MSKYESRILVRVIKELFFYVIEPVVLCRETCNVNKKYNGSW